MLIRGQISREYAAGFFDGEGCFHVARRADGRSRHYYGVVKLAQKTPEVMQMFADEWGGKVYYNKSWQGWQWHVTGDNSRLFALDMWPYLLVKKRQAELYIEFMHIRKGQRYNPITEEELALKERLRQELIAEKG